MKDFGKDTHIDFFVHNLKATNMKAALSSMADIAAEERNVKAQNVLSSLMKSNSFSQAAVGHGIAIPNAKMSGLKKPITILATLGGPVTFKDAPDHEPIDIMCLLLSPYADGPIHLRRLSRLSRFLLNEEMGVKMRAAENEEALRMAVHNYDGWLIAA